MGYLIERLQHGRAIAKREGPRTNISWSSDGQTLDNSNDILCFLQDFGVLVCKEHHNAIVNLNTHLLQHHSVPATTRKQIVERFSHFTPVDPAEVQLPDEPIKKLKKPLDELRCRTCGLTTVSKDAIRMHCKNNHQQAWTREKSLLVDSVKVQTLFRTGGLQKYFDVATYDAADQENTVVEEIVAEQLAEYQSTQQQIQEELQIFNVAAKTDKTGWFKRTGWLEHFKERNLVHLAHQARLPDQSERKLKLAAELTDRLIERSVKGLSTLARETRRWLRSARQTEVDPRPLTRLQNPEKHQSL
jgi:hypothetical protein